ncbi:hypothetical protein MN116_002526 [Schistosoma mekongi]|uniref:BAT2 N-terminal domain-containing protein n=1 Tax=Schistosoma mekongi TaxID=38744 RepID=A0AAE1ZJN8_SCHME|nr:hypothetical protein MN116_002526 [Schistosoma mekongi]
MSSKVKSEKTKVKFPQSNINHVYKGNTTEPQHKPALRQYGMQVVGKLQGTRRLPPPAWVPSIKAETGGLDSRISLVPAGGGGWGVPSTSISEQQDASSTSTNSLPTVPTLPSVNGVLYSETVGISLEPAYTKLAYGNSDPGGVGVSASSDTLVGVNGSINTSKTQEVITKDKVPSQPLKSQNDKLGSAGGLAANKPFFQRPAPVVTTSSTTTTTSTKSDIPAKTDGGAREIVGEPSGWVAISQDEPDFDERIIFSDDEDYEAKSIRSTTATSHLSEQPAPFCTPPPNTVKTNLHSAPMKPFVNPPNNLSEPCVMQSHSTVPQNMYIDGSNLITSDAWSAADISYTRNCSLSHSRPPALNMPYSMPPINAPCVITSDTNRSLQNVQFMNHTTSTPGVDPFFSTHPLQSRLVASFAGSITDSVRSTTDVDIELQQAQRQARTQEYKNAVERAQQARARQKLPENFSVESDNMLSTPPLGLISSMSESRPVSSVPAPFTTTVCQVGPNYLFPVGDHSSVNHMLNVPPHNLLPPTFPTSGPLDITTAIAAATAAAMAYTGGVDSGVPEKSGVEMPISIPSIMSHTQMPMSASSNTVTAGGWQAPFASNNSMPAAVVRLLSQQPHMAQLLQNALNMSSGNSQMPKSTQHSQGVFVNPDFFVERFLEIFNQPQNNRPQGPLVNSSKNLSSETNTQATISTLRQDQSSTSTVDSCLRGQFGSAMQISDNLDDSVTHNVKEFDGSSEKTHRVHRISQSSNRSDAPVVTTNTSITNNDSSNQRTTRVPGLMDIKVSCASSQHLAHLWDKGDHLLDPGYHVYRGRGKSLTPYKSTRGGTKGRGTTKSHPVEAVIGDLKSISLREVDNLQYPSDDYDVSRRSHSVSKSSKSWHSKPSRSVDDSLIDAYSTNTRVKSEFINDEHIRYRKQVRNVLDDNCWTRTNLNNNDSSPSVLSTGSDSNECGVLSDVQEADGTEDDKGYDQCLDDSGKKVSQRLGKLSHPNQTSVSDNKEKNKSLSGTYNRRARRARVGTNSHFTSSRSYTTDDFSSYTRRYSKGSEQDYYWRQYYGSGTRSTRSGHSAGLNIDQRKNRSHDDILYRPSERQASRSVASGSFAGISGYFSGRMTRSYVQYESSRVQNNRELDSQHYITNGRQLRSQKIYYSHKGQFSSATDFSHEYVASDEENKSSHARFSNHPESRAKTYAVSGRFHKAYRKNPTSTPTKSELNSQQSTDNEQVTKLTLDGIANYNQTEDIDDSEVPTVRVPASDTVTINSHYIKSRTNRYATHKVLGTSKRVSSNRASQNHQSKRPNGSVHTSRRYREMRDRYNDEKDGDGGAAAGGVGRSGASSSVSASIIFKTGTGGSSNSRGGSNHCSGGGGHTDSAAVEFIEQENVDDVSNVATESLDENNMNPRSLMRRRQTAGTTTSSAGGIAPHTETSTVSTSSSVINGTVRKSEKSSHLSGTNSANQQSTTRTSRSGTTSYHGRNNMPSIPPLMSIKPHTSFTENSSVLDSFPTWDNRTERKSDTVFRDDFRGKFSQSVKEFDELNQEIFESDTPHGDGFTKVVSKASKYFARRRMQQEIAFSSDFRRKKTNAFSKTLGNATQAFTKENSSITATFTQNYANTNDYKIQFSGLSKNLLNKKKYLPTKVSFMGPPLCIDTTHTSSVCTVTTSNLSGLTNQSVAYSSSTASPTSSVLQKISFSTTRTWSKVVGTKFMKVPPVNLGDVTNTSPTISLNPSPVWHEEHSHQINTNECTEQDKKLLNSTTATASTSSMESSVTCSYASMQSLWSTGDNTTRVNKSDLTTNGLLLASSTIHSTAVSTSGTLCTVSPSTTLSSQISNNICKVRPQQQQLHVTSISPLVPTSMHLNLSPSNNIIDNISTADLIAETERSDFECCSDIGRSTAILRPHTADILQNSATLSSNSFQSWPSSNTLYTPFSLSNIPVNHHENMFSGNIWPTVDPSMDTNINCMTGSYNPSSNQSYFQNQLNSNVFSNVLTHNNTVASLDSITKQSNIPVTPRQQNIPSYPSSMLTPTDRINIYSNSPYGNSSTELAKLSNNMCVPSQQMTFVSGAPSLYVHPQSTAIQPAPSRSFHSLSLPVQSQMSQARKCRQQIPHQIDPSTFTAGYTSFPTDIKNEYNFPLSVAGCIPPPPTGGLYSAIHPHSQSNYPQNSGIHTIGFPTTVNSYSLLGNPSATSNLQGAGQPYAATIGPTAGTGGGLLPHPVPQGGYNNTPCHFSTPITSNSVSNYVNASNYVGVIGGGRPNADHPSATVRQRSLQHHSLFTHPNLPQSPSAQGQPSFQLSSSFYPSISPSHQRVSLQQYGGASRGGVTGPNYPQNGLYGPAFGSASHPSNQATPPPIGHQLNPMGFYNNAFQYPSRPDRLH